MVRIWERRFGELHLMVEPVEPDAKIFERIKAKIVEIAPSEPAPDGKPAVEGSPQPLAATGSTPNTDTPKPAESLPNGEAPKPPDVAATVGVIVPADGTAPKPQDVPAGEASPTSESGKPPETSPAPAAVAPGPVIPTAVAPTATEREPVAEGAIPAPPALPPAPLKLPDETPDRVADRPARRPEITIVIRSRGRWRMLGVCMTLLVVGLAALLAAWRFIPDRLPARLRPAELMTSIGIQAPPRAAPAVRPAPPESQFDE
jgi:hypothetical protein